MKISIYLGPRQTDLDAVFACLVQNRDLLLKQRILIADPARSHELIGEALHKLESSDTPEDIRSGLITSLLDGAQADRIVICDDNALGPVLGPLGLFPMASVIAAALSDLFQDHELTLYLSLRNPATYLPDLYSGYDGTFDVFLNGCEPEAVLWSDTIENLSEAHDAPIVLWRSEDSPLIWADVVFGVAGCVARIPLAGLYDFPHTLMTPEGIAGLDQHLAQTKPRFAAQKQEAIRRYLAEHASENITVQEIDLPGWDDAYIDAMTDAYDADMAVVGEIKQVRLLRPEPD